ncbi:MAG: glycosyltransferase family 2 protein [Nitrospirae bacterium]|nr:glycosyltransferase family 2 protein [Nitrospirota bacterium]
MKLWVVIPAYNEAATIGEVIRQVRTADLPGLEKEVLVVDDGSSDPTASVARAQGAVVIRHLVNRGLGGALGTGIEAALRRDADVIITYDADGQHSPADIAKIIEPILTGRADVVIGSRMADPGGMPWTRRVANSLANLVTWVLFGIQTTDSQSGLRAFSRAGAQRIRIWADRYEVSSEICAEIHRRRLRLAEVPIRAVYTKYSLSKGQGFRVGLRTLFRLLLFRRLKQP